MRASGGGEPSEVRPEPGRASATAGDPGAACGGPNGHGHGIADGLRPGQTSARPLPDLSRTCGRGA